MGTCVTSIPKETTSTDINVTSKRLHPSNPSDGISQKYIQSTQSSVHEHESSSDGEIKQNFSSYLSKTEPNITIKYDLSTESKDAITAITSQSPYTDEDTTQLQRVRDSFVSGSTKALCGVDYFDEMLLFGFIGDIETKNSLIPMEICRIILVYFSEFIGNVFDSNRCSQKLEINDNGCGVHKVDNDYGYYSVYHSVWINSLSNAVIIYHLSVSCERSTSIFVGFSATDNVIEEGFWTNREDYNYAVSLGGSKYVNGHGSDYNDMCALNIRSGDSIQIKMDLMNDEISIKTSSDHEELIMFENIKKRHSIKYKFAAGFSWNAHQNDSIVVNNIQHYGL